MKKRAIILFIFALSWLALGEVWAFPAAPTLSNVSSTQVNIGGKDYFEVSADLNGTGVTGQAYFVPAEFLYPANPGECNGTGIVDLLNNSAMILLAGANANPPTPPLASGRARLTDEFLGRKGYSYVSVQWESIRGTTNVIGLFNTLFGTNYFIPATNPDQFGIVLDAADLLSSPPAGLPGSPCAVSTVAGYGFSASTVPLNLLKQPGVVGPLFANAFAARYDGLIWDSITAGFLPFPIAKTGVKTIAISAETDVQLFGNSQLVRGENSAYRAYEVAGGTHVSRDQHDLDDIVPTLPFVPNPPTRQNLARDSTFFRAMMEHLRSWMTDEIPPPPSVFFDGSNYPFLPLPCVGLLIPGIADIPRDEDGNALGGIRLPYTKTEVCEGDECKTIGSPLGVYNGVETQYGCSAGGFPQVAIVTGTFIRDDSILDRYVTHGKYVSGVSNAAAYAFEQGWILEEDMEAYSDVASHCAVGKVDTEDLTLDDLKDCHSL